MYSYEQLESENEKLRNSLRLIYEIGKFSSGNDCRQVAARVLADKEES